MIVGILEILIGFCAAPMTTAGRPKKFTEQASQGSRVRTRRHMGRRPRIVADPPPVVSADDLVPADADLAHLQSRE
jgi:hypothetical protein